MSITFKKKKEIKKVKAPEYGGGGAPKGREDNPTAEVVVIYGDDNDQVMVMQDLHGCKYWNISDLAIVRRARKWQNLQKNNA